MVDVVWSVFYVLVVPLAGLLVVSSVVLHLIIEKHKKRWRNKREREEEES
jgi:heme exporter protein D